MDFDDPVFRELIDALHDGVYITDADGITLKVNSAYERLTGLRAEDVVGQHMQALVEQGVISQSVSLRVLKEGKALSRQNPPGSSWIEKVDCSKHASVIQIK